MGYLLFTLLSRLQVRMERDYSYAHVNAGFSLKEFFSFLGVCSLDVFFGQQFFHFPIDLYQLKHPGIFDSKFV